VVAPFEIAALGIPSDIRWPLPAHPAPPKVTMSAANPAHGIANAQEIAPTDLRLLILGTELHAVGAYWQPDHLSTAGNFTIPPYKVAFYTDTDLIRFRAQGFGMRYRLLVDGQWAHGANDAPAYTFNADGGFHTSSSNSAPARCV
jgi:hypothetical protein